jgi:hypothetical protein
MDIRSNKSTIGPSHDNVIYIGFLLNFLLVLHMLKLWDFQALTLLPLYVHDMAKV